MKKTAGLIFILLGLTCFLKAQDPHFSQFFASPLTLNPATDVFENVSERELNYGAAAMAALVYLVSEHGL